MQPLDSNVKVRFLRARHCAKRGRTAGRILSKFCKAGEEIKR